MTQHHETTTFKSTFKIVSTMKITLCMLCLTVPILPIRGMSMSIDLQSKPARDPISLPGGLLTLDPVLGTNIEFRAPSNLSNEISLSTNNLDSISPSESDPIRTTYNSDAKVHILRSSTHLWKTMNWLPSKAIKAAEEYNSWTTGRHHLYPTTDIPAINLPNGMGKATLDLATRVILPSIAFAFDTPLERLNFKDMFVAKYEPKGQPGLGRHTDGSAYSFNMLLSDPKGDFEGGGTWIEPVGLVKPEMGDVLMHRGSILHEGCPVTDGARYVLVGFVQSDDASGVCIRNANGNSELLLKTVNSFPLGMVVEVDEGDEFSCATVADVLEEGAANAAGLQRGDCIRGLLIPNKKFIGFDGKTFDEVMELLVGRKGFGPLQMVVERWCEE